MTIKIKSKLNHLLNESRVYITFSFCAVVASLIPLMFKGNALWMNIVEYCTTTVFIFEYIARWILAGKTGRHGRISYLIYPFTPMAIIDLLTILPTFILINQGLRALRAVRLILIARLFRFVKDSRSVRVLSKVMERERDTLGVVCVLAIAYIFTTALIEFNVEPDTFNNFFDALYWACISLTTVGYGDLYPISLTGRIISMISALAGIAIVALPAGIITGGYIEAIKEYPHTAINAAALQEE